MTESFECWAYRNGFLRHLHQLERARFVEGEGGKGRARGHRLTEAGWLRAVGGRDPEARWRRGWDGEWRLALYDVPQKRQGARDRMRKYLKSQGFGYLQNSAWITPDPAGEYRSWLGGGLVDVEGLIFLNARPGAGETDEQIVAGAWDFRAINEKYRRYEAVLAHRPTGPVTDEVRARAFHCWMKAEREAWLQALKADPLLPACLLPADYAGRPAAQKRQEAMREASENLRSFKAAIFSDKKKARTR